MLIPRKPIIAVTTPEETKLIYSVAAHGNRSFRLLINDKAVETIFDTEKDAFDYAKSCADIDKYFYFGGRVEIIQ
nr:MAG TPA: hypothetical protein [Caudoviricetes sp.]